MEEPTSRTLQRAEWLTFLAGSEESREAFRKGELTGTSTLPEEGHHDDERKAWQGDVQGPWSVGADGANAEFGPRPADDDTGPLGGSFIS